MICRLNTYWTSGVIAHDIIDLEKLRITADTIDTGAQKYLRKDINTWTIEEITKDKALYQISELKDACNRLEKELENIGLYETAYNLDGIRNDIKTIEEVINKCFT